MTLDELIGGVVELCNRYDSTGPHSDAVFLAIVARSANTDEVHKGVFVHCVDAEFSYRAIGLTVEHLVRGLPPDMAAHVRPELNKRLKVVEREQRRKS